MVIQANLTHMGIVTTCNNTVFTIQPSVPLFLWQMPLVTAYYLAFCHALSSLIIYCSPKIKRSFPFYILPIFQGLIL